MLRIKNQNGRQTDYSKSYLQTEAKKQVRLIKESDGILRGWYLEVREGATVVLCVDYLTKAQEPATSRIAI